MKKSKISAAISDLGTEFQDLHAKLQAAVNDVDKVDLGEILKITNSMISNADQQSALSKFVKE